VQPLPAQLPAKQSHPVQPSKSAQPGAAQAPPYFTGAAQAQTIIFTRAIVPIRPSSAFLACYKKIFGFLEVKIRYSGSVR